MEDLFQVVRLEEITPNPLNPRKQFSGKKFDELVESIRQKGVIQPVLLRPKDGGYELVAGERRYRASLSVELSTIPAIVRELSDDDAFDIMTIENLHREDLTELEEAESFRAYVDRHGPGSVERLAECAAISTTYIRRRIAVLGLPETVLQAWGKGELKYSHLEQLSRVENPKRVKELAKKAIEWRMPASRLAEEIEDNAVALRMAKFDTIRAGCPECPKNSAVQKRDRGVGDDDLDEMCLDPACFKKHLNDYLQGGNFKKHYRTGTNGFRFVEDAGMGYDGKYMTFESWTGKPGKKCKACEHFLSVIKTSGELMHKHACFGERTCFNVIRVEKRKEAASKDGKEEKQESPRVAWHGEYFREEFFQRELPGAVKGYPADDGAIMEMVLFALLEANTDLHADFARRYKLTDCHGREPKDRWFIASSVDLFDAITKLRLDVIYEELREAALRTVLDRTKTGTDARWRLGERLGLDLRRDWRITCEYLDKKTVGEMLELGESLGIFADRHAQAFLHEVLGKKRGKWKTCKKSELKRIFLESGVDLAGKVPAEVLNDGI